MEHDERPRARSPWKFVPTLYFLQAIPYFAVATATGSYFTQVGVTLADIGAWSSWLTLPWSLKALWSPLVEFTGTKRRWTLAMQALVAVCLGALALACGSAEPLVAVVVAGFALALASATHDVAADGFYLLALEKRQQELFVGVRNTFFRIGRIAVMGGTVWLAGVLQEGGVEIGRSWALAFGACAALYALVVLWNVAFLPRPRADGPARERGARAPIGPALRSYFARPGIVGIVAFIFFFRAAESLLTPMISPFLLKSRESGGLGLAPEDLGRVYGTIGTIALLVGGIGGGAFIAQRGLARSIWPMALAMHATNLLYVWLAHAQPGLAAVTLCIAVEQLAYGFGFAAYMVFLMQVSRGSRFATTHYAISTGLMGLAALLAGKWSGTLVERCGWEDFFWIVCGTSTLGLVVIFAAPLAEKPAPEDPVA